jgi:hypothetical protein
MIQCWEERVRIQGVGQVCQIIALRGLTAMRKIKEMLERILSMPAKALQC